jgi:hypothetical protein
VIPGAATRRPQGRAIAALLGAAALGLAVPLGTAASAPSADIGTSPSTSALTAGLAPAPSHSVASVVVADATDADFALGGRATLPAFPEHAALIFTDPATLDAGAGAEIDRVLDTTAADHRAFLLGPAISDDVATALAARGLKIERVSEADATGTAADLARRLFPGGGVQSTAFLVAPGDATAAALASVLGAPGISPVLLAGAGDAPATATAAYLGGGKVVTVVLVGSTAAISAAQEQAYRAAGYTVRRVVPPSTAAAVAATPRPTPPVLPNTGTGQPRALLAAAVLAAIAGLARAARARAGALGRRA